MPGSSVRIAIIGAGSAVFSLELLGKLCLTPGLRGSQVVLMDVDEQRLEAVSKVAERLAREMGADLRFESTLDRQAALQGTDFVINTAYASGHKRAVDFRKAAAQHRYYYSNAGIYGPIDLWAFDDLQFRLDFARDMERFCPSAWLLQSGNPVFEGCTLMTRETSVKVIGICHGYLDYRAVTQVLGLDPQRITWRASGLNHQIWLTSLMDNGNDAYPVLDEWIETRAEEHWRAYEPRDPHDIVMSRGAVNLYQLYGLMPIGDTVRDPINWWLHTDFATKRHWFGQPWGGPDTQLGRQAFVAALQARIRKILQVASDPTASAADLVGTTQRESHVAIIDAIANGNSGQFQVNVPNKGTLPGVPDDVVVEISAVIDSTGVHPIPVPALPRKIMLEQILPRVLQMEQQLEAFRTGDPSMLLWGALMNHQTRSYEQAVEVLDGLLQMAGHGSLKAHHHGGQDRSVSSNRS